MAVSGGGVSPESQRLRRIDEIEYLLAASTDIVQGIPDARLGEGYQPTRMTLKRGLRYHLVNLET